MPQNKINWWAIMAIAIIGIPLGFVIMGVINKGTTVPINVAIEGDSVFTFEPNSKGTSQLLKVKGNTTLTIGEIMYSDSSDNMEWMEVFPQGILHDDATEKATVKEFIITVTNDNSTDQPREATFNITWNDKNKHTQIKQIKVVQEKKVSDPPQKNPIHVTIKGDSVFTFVSDSKGTSKKLKVKGNTTVTIEKIKYSDTPDNMKWMEVTPQEIPHDATDKATVKEFNITITNNNSAALPRQATFNITWEDENNHTLKKQIKVFQEKNSTKEITEKVQGIMVSGKHSELVSDACQIIVNGSISTNYQDFRNGVNLGSYSDIKVTNLEYDNKIVSKVYVTANVQSGEDD